MQPAVVQRAVDSPFREAGLSGWSGSEKVQASLPEPHGRHQQQQQQQQAYSVRVSSARVGAAEHIWTAPEPTHVTSSVSALALNGSAALSMAVEAQSLSRRSSHHRRNYVDAEPSLIDGDTSLLSATSVEDATDISAFGEDSFLQSVAPGLAAWLGPDVTGGQPTATSTAAGAGAGAAMAPGTQLIDGAGAARLVPEHAGNVSCMSPCSAIDASYSEIVCQGSVEGLPHEALLHAQEQGGEVSSAYCGRTPSPAAWQHWQPGPQQKQGTPSAQQLLQQQQQQQQQLHHQRLQQEAQRWQQANAVQQQHMQEQQSQLQPQQQQQLSKSLSASGSASSSKAVACLLKSGSSNDDVPLSQITQVTGHFQLIVCCNA